MHFVSVLADTLKLFIVGLELETVIIMSLILITQKRIFISTNKYVKEEVKTY